jgi:hypothetical protein
MPLIPFGEYRPDVTDYDQSSTGAVLNALPRGDGYGPFPAFAAYSAALPGPCRGFFKAIKTDGSIAISAATRSSGSTRRPAAGTPTTASSRRP